MTVTQLVKIIALQGTFLGFKTRANPKKSSNIRILDNICDSRRQKLRILYAFLLCTKLKIQQFLNFVLLSIGRAFSLESIEAHENLIQSSYFLPIILFAKLRREKERQIETEKNCCIFAVSRPIFDLNFSRKIDEIILVVKQNFFQGLFEEPFNVF